MYKRSRLAGILGCAATLAMVGCAANSGVAPLGATATTQQQAGAMVPAGKEWVYSGGVLYHTPHYMPTRQNASKVRQAVALSYGGGPVLVAPKVYLIIWGWRSNGGDPDKVKRLLRRYDRFIGGSGHDNIYTQYYMKSGGSTINITNPANQDGGEWADNTTPVPSHPTDSQVAQEALNGVAHFGYDPSGSYVVATPTQHSSSGFGSVWCAYHSATTYNGKYVSYTNLPYMPDAAGNCGSNIIAPPSDETGTDDGVTIVEGHELGESITDPVPFSGWNSSYGEIGDLCAWYNIQNDPFGAKSYTSQPMWSNASSSCVHSYP